MATEYDTVIEKVPKFIKRDGDKVIAGSNNCIIVLGTDRNSDARSGYGSATNGGQGSGAIYVGVGRNDENLSLKDDKSFLYLSMKSDPDKYCDIKQGKSSSSTSSAILSSDSVRLIGKKNLKITVGNASIIINSDGSITLDGDIKLGENAIEKTLKGNSFMTYFMTHTHPVISLGSPTGPVTPAPPPPQNIYSSKVLSE